jgi:sporulation protein YqfC
MDELNRFLDLPKEIMLDLPKVTIVGNIQAMIENHRGIIEYGTDKIRIAINSGELEVTGEKLSIRNITRDEIYLDGDIFSVKYHR